MRDAVDTRLIVEDMRYRGFPGVLSVKDLMEYTGRSYGWVKERFGNLGGNGISVVSAARILGGLHNA